jgi:arylsulfatase A-like enzyme
VKINRRHFLIGGSAFAALAGLGAYWTVGRKMLSSKPNIILFIADDMRFDATGYAGNTIVKTPYLDKLAAESCVFDNAFVTTSVCPCSRASIMSGEYMARHGVREFDQPMAPESYKNSFFQHLKREGYYSGYIGKWGIGEEEHMPEKGTFDQWYGFSGLGKYFEDRDSTEHLTDRQTRQAMRFLRTRPKDKPFLLIVAYKAAHDPLIPQRRFAELYKNVSIPRDPTDNPKAVRSVPLVLRRGDFRQPYKFDDEGNREYENEMRRYYALVSGLDESIGKVVKELSRQKINQKTSLMFISDNGRMAGDHGMDGKWSMYEGSIRVPFLIRPAKEIFPAIKPSRVKEMVLNVDIAPTIMSMAGLDVPSRMQGEDLLGVMVNPAKPLRDGFYYEYMNRSRIRYTPMCVGYRSRTMKYARYYEGDKTIAECFYDLEKDPRELVNEIKNPKYSQQIEQFKALIASEQKRLA